MAAIAELVYTTEEFILVTAHSNSACDEIALRLLDVLRDGDLYRIYAKSFNKENLNIKLKPLCNLRDGEFQFPSLDYIYQYRVVVMTLLTAGTLVRARGEDQNFNSGHFTRLLIDESGCIHEPVSMIPIAGMKLLLSFYRFCLNPELHSFVLIII